MTPKLRTHCATTLAALALTLPVASYAYAESPLTHAEDARGEGEGQRGDSGRDGRHYGPGRKGDARNGRFGGEARDERGPHGGEAHGGGGRYGRDGHGEERGYSGGQGGRADDDGPDRPTHRHGIPAHGSPSAPRVEGSTPSPDNGDGDRPAAPRHPGKPGTPPAGTAAERPDPSPTASLAGRQAGEGRLRPGRTAVPSLDASPSPDRPHGHDGHEHGVDRGREPDEDMTPRTEDEDESQAVPDEPSPSEPTSADDASPAAAGESHPQPVSQPLERQIPVLTLGAGCALMGLGLGYMGLRLRRG
ncbi:hypothetical protein [Streptomyces wuyuanensis]|uniref:Uncharacterized protein n=1 Tax=Streptomyces wuyuanensis TaxID=1196353 RepID=A0A1G9RX12_9ACTN|nr:hypothetical protein [Streptomyces wuyuanensis]SDM27704.1 hypothetical protein SAMN05444921_10631 [Streptomyces wuyuanensis]